MGRLYLFKKAVGAAHLVHYKERTARSLSLEVTIVVNSWDLRYVLQQRSDSVGTLRFEVTGSGSHADLFFQAPWWSLKKQFKGVFHNVSRVLDCVSCQKCRLHAKVGRRRMTTSHDDGGAESRESTGASLCHVATNVLITHYSSAIGHTQYVNSASPSRALLTLTHSSPLTSRS